MARPILSMLSLKRIIKYTKKSIEIKIGGVFYLNNSINLLFRKFNDFNFELLYLIVLANNIKIRKE